MHATLVCSGLVTMSLSVLTKLWRLEGMTMTDCEREKLFAGKQLQPACVRRQVIDESELQRLAVTPAA